MSHTPIRSFSTAPLQPVSGQFPILKAAALACLPSSTSVPKRMLHVLLPYQFTLVLHSTSSTRLRTVPHFESSSPRLPAFEYVCPEKMLHDSAWSPTLHAEGTQPAVRFKHSQTHLRWQSALTRPFSSRSGRDSTE
jgi:hypothetical protein